MTGRIAWITGASTGIGRGLAERMAREGWTVAASARGADSLAEAVAAGSGRIHAYPLDVADEAATAEVARRIAADLGAIDLAVMCAGTYQPVDAAAFEVAPFRQMNQVNYMGVVHALGAVLPAMVARRSGHVAVVASVAGYGGLPRAAAYGPTKAALINLVESIRFDLERHGVKAQVVCPGFVRTPLTAQNPFEMPFLMEVDDAVDQLYRGLMSDRFEIVFPKIFACILKVLNMLPYPLYFRLIRRSTGL